MNAADGSARSLASTETHAALGNQWRALRRAATLVALLATPAVYVWLHNHVGWSTGWSIAAALGLVIVMRGAMDLVFRRFIPWPSLFGAADDRMAEEDVLNRRRAWFWKSFFRWGIVLGGIAALLAWAGIGSWFTQIIPLLIIFPFYFIFNFLILLGPMMWMGISQIHGYEPGDATWGVKLDHVRGQAEAKEEVRRIVDLWQSGEIFEEAGGQRERGLLFLGAPGTGKTMLAKAIATGFNSPIITIPGSGFAQTFIGIDALMVRYLARKAKKLASKWGGQCIVFIDEIDAVGTRRSQLQGQSMTPLESPQFFGPWGSLNSSGDLVVESAAWRDHLYELRAPEPTSPYAPWMRKVGNILNQFPGGMLGGMGGMGQLALNQLLVTMDGIDNPPFWRRFWTNRFNNLLDASYVVPRRVRNMTLRFPPARPAGNQIYFIGATNVPLSSLDPAIQRPGRMGRHVWFRTPTKHDREDIFELYLGKVSHNPELDTPRARDELARITNGYSPAMVEQVCSMALTRAHHEGRLEFTRDDIIEAMTTVESGTAVGVEYVPEETRAVAIHEAGHAATAHVFMKGVESTRISIKMRAGSLGHHQALEKEERFSSWKSEEMGKLAWTLGAMAAEHVFYGENATGVGGDLQSATGRAAFMVGISGMGPDRIELNGKARQTQAKKDEEREKVEKRFEEIGFQLMNRASGDFQHDATASVLGDPTKRRLAAQIIGQAYLNAYNMVLQNREGVEKIADTVVARRELYGDELVDLLNSAQLKEPVIDLSKEESWPTL
jgi:cell division protease FtsH